MKRLLPLLFILVVLPRTVPAEDVQVRLYTAHPPGKLTILATEGELHWKACATCEEQGERKLLISNSSEATAQEWFVTGSYELRPDGAPSFSAQFPLHVQSHKDGLLVVVAMPIEQYVEHVLMAESGDFKNPEAQKAMAVAARTYAMRFGHQHAADGFDFCDTTHCQVFSWKNVNERIRTAVTATQGELLTYDGKPAATYFHQNCGGTLAAASEAWAQVSEPYLQVHKDPFCVTSGGLRWESTLSHEQIDGALRASGLQVPANWKAIEITSHGKSGRTRSLNLSGGNPATFPLAASTFRFAVDRALGWNQIRSDLYEVRNFGDKVSFSGSGSGHGVGLCQAGAEEMAREGKNYREILDFYYPGTQVVGQEKEAWQKRASERFDLISANPDRDSEVLSVAERVLGEDEENIGWQLSSHVKLQVFPSLDSYRNTTGQPGWVAASTRGQTIRLQPLAELRRRSILESTLRHELLHLLVESRTAKPTPLWFREGLVIYLSSSKASEPVTSAMTLEQAEQVLKRGGTRKDTQEAYGLAHKTVAALIQQYGKQTVLAWLSDGLPVEITRRLLEIPASATHN